MPYNKPKPKQKGNRRSRRLPAVSEKQLQLWRSAEEIFNKSPVVVQKEILKYIDVILVKTEIQEAGTLQKIGKKVLRFAKNGQLKPLQKILKDNNFLPEIVNFSNQWEEVEERWGYDKSWTWNSDTPLLEAIRAGHLDVVMFLLRSGADPTLRSCVENEYDVYQAASELAQKRGDPRMISIVGLAIPFWEKTNDSHPGGTRDFSKPNRPTSLVQLGKELENC